MEDKKSDVMRVEQNTTATAKNLQSARSQPSVWMMQFDKWLKTQDAKELLKFQIASFDIEPKSVKLFVSSVFFYLAEFLRKGEAELVEELRNQKN